MLLARAENNLGAGDTPCQTKTIKSSENVFLNACYILKQTYREMITQPFCRHVRLHALWRELDVMAFVRFVLGIIKKLTKWMEYANAFLVLLEESAACVAHSFTSCHGFGRLLAAA